MLDYHELVAWVSLLLGTGTLATVAKMLVDAGDRKRARQQLERDVEALRVKCTANEAGLTAHRLESVQVFASKELALEIEKRLTSLFEGLRGDIRDDFRSLADRFDRAFEHRSPQEGRR